MKETTFKTLTLRIDTEILEKVRAISRKEGRSMNRQIIWIIKKELERKKQEENRAF